MNMEALSAVFPANEIEWRVGSTNSAKTSGLALAYLTARHVMDRLDEVCGPANWQDRYEFHGSRTICYLSIRIEDEWVTKADGAGDSDVEAEKGAISDALKRAAVKWGIGRYLYDLGNTWVDIEAAGRSYKIKADQYAKLERTLNNQFGGTISQPKPADSPKPEHSFNYFLNHITEATAIEPLQAVFKEAWRSKLPDADKGDLKAAYEAKKAELNQASGYREPDFSQFENLPAETQQAVKNLGAG